MGDSGPGNSDGSVINHRMGTGEVPTASSEHSVEITMTIQTVEVLAALQGYQLQQIPKQRKCRVHYCQEPAAHHVLLSATRTTIYTTCWWCDKHARGIGVNWCIVEGIIG